MKEILEFMMQDFMHPAFYLPKAAAIGVLTAGIIRTGCMFFPGSRFFQWLFKKRRALFLFSIYFYVLLWEAFFSRPPGSRNTISLTLFQTWGETAQSHAYVIENVLMFIPFGILISILAEWKTYRQWWYCLLAGLLSSTVLELAQLAARRGHCQLDDVLMNTLGAGIGWCILWCFLKARNCKAFNP